MCLQLSEENKIINELKDHIRSLRVEKVFLQLEKTHKRKWRKSSRNIRSFLTCIFKKWNMFSPNIEFKINLTHESRDESFQSWYKMICACEELDIYKIQAKILLAKFSWISNSYQIQFISHERKVMVIVWEPYWLREKFN